MKGFKMFYINVQLDKASVNPLDLCLKWRGLQLCRQPSLGGSRWPDPDVHLCRTF